MSTTVPISEMSAGREMDVFVHEKVLGLPVSTEAEMQEIALSVWKEQPRCRLFQLQIPAFSAYPRPDGGVEVIQDILPYSSDIATAWEVMEWLRERSIVVLRTVNDGWQCTTWTEVGQFRNVRHESHGDTAPEAICRCALEVVVGRE